MGIYTYAEFFSCAVGFLPCMALSQLRHRADCTRRIQGRWMRRFGRTSSRLTPVWRFSTDGAPPPDIFERGYVVVSNHESTADPFLLSFLPWDMRWVAKEEIFKLPLLGWLMHLSGDIPLKRGQRESVKTMMAECQKTLRAGMPVMMFPEGTRSPDGKLLPFKDGAFRLAIEAEVPILPVAIAGTRTCRPKGSLWFGQSRAHAIGGAPFDRPRDRGERRRRQHQPDEQDDGSEDDGRARRPERIAQNHGEKAPDPAARVLARHTRAVQAERRRGDQQSREATEHANRRGHSAHVGEERQGADPEDGGKQIGSQAERLHQDVGEPVAERPDLISRREIRDVRKEAQPENGGDRRADDPLDLVQNP